MEISCHIQSSGRGHLILETTQIVVMSDDASHVGCICGKHYYHGALCRNIFVFITNVFLLHREGNLPNLERTSFHSIFSKFCTSHLSFRYKIHLELILSMLQMALFFEMVFLYSFGGPLGTISCRVAVLELTDISVHLASECRDEMHSTPLPGCFFLFFSFILRPDFSI